MFCSYCGASIADGSAFCNACGKSLSAQPTTSPEVQMQQSYQAQKTAIRQSEIDAMQSLLDYFSPKSEDYEAYDACCELVSYYSKGAKSSLLVWGIIITVAGLFAMLSGPEAFLGSLIGFVVPGAAMIVGGIFMKIANRKNHKEYLDLYSKLSVELNDYYNAYPNCPVGPEYSNPAILSEIMRVLQSGRADTIKESINRLIDDASRSDIESYLYDIEQHTAAASANTRAAAIFLAADFFLK